LQNMETATDSCKDAAAAMEAIAVKNAWAGTQSVSEPTIFSL
jgi:hypothetical protein